MTLLHLCPGIKVQTWTQGGRFPTYCPNGCEPTGHDFQETINVRYTKIPGTGLEWRSASFGKGKVRKCICMHNLTRAEQQTLLILLLFLVWPKSTLRSSILSAVIHVCPSCAMALGIARATKSRLAVCHKRICTCTGQSGPFQVAGHHPLNQLLWRCPGNVLRNFQGVQSLIHDNIVSMADCVAQSA